MCIVFPPPHRTLRLDGNQLVCVPLTAQMRAALVDYYGPETLCAPLPVPVTSSPWTVGFGDCSFSGNYAGAPLVRSGSCPTQGGTLDLSRKGITSVPADAFAGMAKMK